MNWEIVYYSAPGNYDEITTLLKSQDIPSNAFLDSDCKDLYVPGYYSTQLEYPVVQRGFVEAPSMIYIAVHPENREKAGQILSQWHTKRKKELHKVSTKTIKAISYFLIISILIGLFLLYIEIKIPYIMFLSPLLFWLLVILYFRSGIHKKSNANSIKKDSFS